MLTNGRMFIGTPYVAATLERGDEEQLIINREEVDCTTFVEYVLAHSPTNVAKMKVYEQALTGQEIHWLPQDKLPATGMPWIKDGDIIAITTHTPGLDVAHMGIAAYRKGKLHLLHASSAQGKVILDALPLNSLLERNSRWTGIRVVRMKNSSSDE